MALGGHTSPGKRMDFEVRIRGIFNPKRPWRQYEEILPGKLYLYCSPRRSKFETPPTQSDLALYCNVSNLSIIFYSYRTNSSHQFYKPHNFNKAPAFTKFIADQRFINVQKLKNSFWIFIYTLKNGFKVTGSWDLDVLFTISLDRYEVHSRAGPCLFFLLWTFSYSNVRKSLPARLRAF
jgi:hypothetical protein